MNMETEERSRLIEDLRKRGYEIPDEPAQVVLRNDKDEPLRIGSHQIAPGESLTVSFDEALELAVLTDGERGEAHAAYWAAAEAMPAPSVTLAARICERANDRDAFAEIAHDLNARHGDANDEPANAERPITRVEVEDLVNAIVNRAVTAREGRFERRLAKQIDEAIARAIAPKGHEHG